jgi:monofunctional biosynthetic peptidoglycan transglycosylase
MKANSKNSLIRSFFFLASLGVFLIPVYMYFSHDVDFLNNQYPVRGDQEVRFETVKPQNWVELREMSPFAKWAIVLSEDWAFYQHAGIDIKQIRVALNEMVEDRRFRGASTITQQLVKNVFLSDDRTLWRKVHEIILAHKIEKVLSKDRILEIYLNIIQFGPSQYGIKAAAEHYFNKSPAEVTPKEAAFLAMLLPSPNRYYNSFKKRELSSFAFTRIDTILAKLRMGKVISPERYQLEKATPLIWEQSLQKMP